jgi:hypothetical protein
LIRSDVSGASPRYPKPVLKLLAVFLIAASLRAQDSAANLVRMHDEWGAKASTPGASLSIFEASRSGPVIRLRLRATGLPKGVGYSIVAWPVTAKGASEVLKGVTLDESGLAVCAGKPGTCGTPQKPNDPIDLPVQPVPGEPVRVGLISADGTMKVFAKIVPVPVDGQDRNCRIEATLLTPAGELILIEASGLGANSDVYFDSESEGENHSAKGQADAEGRYVTSVLPYKEDVVRGTLKVRLRSASCSPGLAIGWGKRN